MENKTKFTEDKTKFMEGETKFMEGEKEFTEDENEFTEDENEFTEDENEFTEGEKEFTEGHSVFNFALSSTILRHFVSNSPTPPQKLLQHLAQHQYTLLPIQTSIYFFSFRAKA
jgi:hypothetical protein